MTAVGGPAGPPADRVLRLGRRTFGPGEFVVMGIVNRTPDSFYDRGAAFAEPAALALAAAHVAAGAAILDIGGVKAGPGDPVPVAEELRRTVDLVAAVRAAHPEVVISVDTYRAAVATEVLAAGADLINDTWGGVDPDLAGVAAAADAGLVCAHAGGAAPRTRPHRVRYADVVGDVVTRTTALASAAVRAGVRPSGVVVDPAHDFGKNTHQSLLVTRRLGALVATGWPVLVALSRKDFIGEAAGGAPPADRLPGTLAATALSAAAGARLFRAHDVAATVQALAVVAAVRDGSPVVAARGLA